MVSPAWCFSPVVCRHSINAIVNITSAGLLATGDDEGHIKVRAWAGRPPTTPCLALAATARGRVALPPLQLWDLRQRTSVCSYRAHEDFIADLVAIPHKKTVLAAGCVSCGTTNRVVHGMGVCARVCV